jgi:hypothetical protein
MLWQTQQSANKKTNTSIIQGADMPWVKHVTYPRFQEVTFPKTIVRHNGVCSSVLGVIPGSSVGFLLFDPGHICTLNLNFYFFATILSCALNILPDGT